MDRIDTGLYFHIPFCRSKCPYCDFYSTASKQCSEEYIDALCDEISSFRRMEGFAEKTDISAVDTVYFGGGTPSLMTGEQLNRVISTVKKNFLVRDGCEITVECNPSSENLREFLVSAARTGVNRISLGMQSASDNERKKLGRKGNADSVRYAVEYARQAGIENISLDVMVGVPDSSMATLENTLDFAVALEVPHISAYMLKIEEGTYYHRFLSSLSLPTEDETADMYLFMSDYLKSRGYLHYEISNFCKEGFYSRHNMKYWDGLPYLGFGPAAHSFFGEKRFFFPRDTEYFLEGKKAIYDGCGGDAEERILLGLRTYKGIELNDKNPDFNNKAEFFAKHGLAEITDGRFSLTAEGFLLSNTIISELLSVL